MGAAVLTNAFKIGGLQQLSWFQLLPEAVQNGSDKIKRSQPHSDLPAATLLWDAHIRLQNDRHLCALVLDSMPFQQDENIKLWVFLPGRHESCSTLFKSTITGLKVVRSGFWCAPGDNDEIASALSHALRNQLERALKSIGYVRFGDVFAKCKSYGASEPQIRKFLPTIEVVFSTSEEGIFANFLIQRKRVRMLTSKDIEIALRSHVDGSKVSTKCLPVVVAPYGLCGELTGCCSGDLVNKICQSNTNAMNDYHLIPGAPSHTNSSFSYTKSARQGLHAEVRLGHHLSCSPNFAEPNIDDKGKIVLKRDRLKIHGNCGAERTLIYPCEAVLVPFMPFIPPWFYLKRSWFQDQVGAKWLEDDSNAVKMFPCTSSSPWSMTPPTNEQSQPQNLTSRMVKQEQNISSSKSTSSGESSIKSSSSQGCSSSSDTEFGAGTELDADADSLLIEADALAASTSKRASLSGLPNDPGTIDIKIEDAKHGHRPGHELQGSPAAKMLRKNGHSSADTSIDILNSMNDRNDFNRLAVVSSSNMTANTPKAISSQVGTPWDWTDDDQALSLDIQNDADILAEFGDFGDFFEDETLGFGEDCTFGAFENIRSLCTNLHTVKRNRPPCTAESQALMFSLADCGEVGTSTSYELSDPMLYPILDIPAFEGFGLQSPSVKDERLQGLKISPKDSIQNKRSPGQSAPYDSHAADSLPKMEATILFAHAYYPVSIPAGQRSLPASVSQSPYVPNSRKRHVDSVEVEKYVYGATPPRSPEPQDRVRKRDHYATVTDQDNRNIRNASELDRKDLPCQIKPSAILSGTGVAGKDQTEKNSDHTESSLLQNGPQLAKRENYLKVSMRNDSFMMNANNLTNVKLATDLECFLLHLSLNNHMEHKQFRSQIELKLGAEKDWSYEGTDTCDISGRHLAKQQLERKKKDRIPSRIAGDFDEEMHDGSRSSQVGVWRAVGAPKTHKVASTLGFENSRSSSPMTPIDAPSMTADDNSSLNSKANQWKELLELLPLLIQQAVVSFDLAFDGICGDGPFNWLASQEQHSRRSACHPGLSHSGCGGMLASCHFLDDSGVELVDPFAPEVSPASVATILQSDIRIAILAAFGEGNIDGPLSLADWCRGHIFGGGDGVFGESPLNDQKENANACVGEPITPPQCSSSASKMSGQDNDNQVLEAQRNCGNNWSMDSSSLPEDAYQRRSFQDAGMGDSESQTIHSRLSYTFIALPMPSILVGYQDDWLKTSASTLHLWEKAPLEPYAMAKPVVYYVICPRIESLLSAAADYIQQLSTMYEACRLGTHVASGVAVQTGLTGNKSTLKGFVMLDYPFQAAQSSRTQCTFSVMNDIISATGKGWDTEEYRNSLRKACRAIPVPANNAIQRDPENSPCTVYYVVSPSMDPNVVLQTMIDASQSIGAISCPSDRECRLRILNQIEKVVTGFNSGEETGSITFPSLMGFVAPKLVLQVLTAETIMKGSIPSTNELDSLKDMAFSVYNKARRISRVLKEYIPQSGKGRTQSSAVPGMWKDCGSGRGSGASPSLLSHDSMLDANAYRTSSWDVWQQSGTMTDPSELDLELSVDIPCYVFEPLFILAEPGSVDQGIGISLTRGTGFEEPGGNNVPTASSENLSGLGSENAEFNSSGGPQKVVSLHCSYGWSEDWQWLISVWTDARGELLDLQLFPTIGILNSVDTKGLQNIFVRVLHHGCQLLLMSNGVGNPKPRHFVICRLGGYLEIECQEWQKAVLVLSGSDPRIWPVQYWHRAFDSMPFGAGSSSFSQDISSLPDRALGLGSNTMPGSPSPSSSLFNARGKSSSFIKTDATSSLNIKHGSSNAQGDPTRSGFQMVHSISFVNVSVDHTLQLVGPGDSSLPGGAHSASNWAAANSSANSISSLGRGVGLVRTLSSPVSYLILPSHGLRFMPSPPLLLPSSTCTSDSPALVQQLEKQGFASSMMSAFVVSKGIPSIRTQLSTTDEWPSMLHVGLVGHMSRSDKPKAGRDESQHVLEGIATELQALSWLTAGPTFPSRRTPLPFHFSVVQRLRRLLKFADSEIGITKPA